MTKKEMDSFVNIFKTNNWNDCIQWIENCWNTDYGTISVKTESTELTLELTTGGWSENEYLINIISNTLFWFLFWQESKRGGYYKFIYTKKINYESEKNNDN